MSVPSETEIPREGVNAPSPELKGDAMPQRFRSKPSEIEAVQWTGETWPECLDFAGAKVHMDGRYPEHELMLLAGKDGAQEWVPVPVGHWLVNVPGDKSDIWPVSPEYFAEKYEAVRGNQDRDVYIAEIEPSAGARAIVADVYGSWENGTNEARWTAVRHARIALAAEAVQ